MDSSNDNKSNTKPKKLASKRKQSELSNRSRKRSHTNREEESSSEDAFIAKALPDLTVGAREDLMRHLIINHPDATKYALDRRDIKLVAQMYEKFRQNPQSTTR